MEQNIDTSNPAAIARAFAHFSEMINQLQNQNQQLLSQIQNSSNSNNSAEIKLPLPDKFDGKISKYRNFMASISNLFFLQPNRFHNDVIKTRFIGSLLSEHALTWFRTLSEKDSPLLDNYEMFLTDFKLNFGDSQIQHNAQTQLRKLKQGKTSTLIYATQFRRLAMDAEFDEIAKKALFRDGLKDTVKDTLATVTITPETFEEFVQFCIKIDNRLFEREQEKMHRISTRDRYNQPTTSFHPGPVPMEIGTSLVKETKKFSKLTEEEKTRRKINNLCLYCGQPNHDVLSCPLKKSSRPTNN